jgi:hypothetical protein
MGSEIIRGFSPAEKEDASRAQGAALRARQIRRRRNPAEQNEEIEKRPEEAFGFFGAHCGRTSRIDTFTWPCVR